MKVYFSDPRPSLAIGRVIANLASHLPEGVTQTDDREAADFIVLHVTGRNVHITQTAQRILESGRKYAVIQYAVKSTRNPDPKDWLPLWQGAQVVWSYYDLLGDVRGFPFYHAPLAADPTVFFKDERQRDYRVGTQGSEASYRIECGGEVRLAAFLAGVRVLHVGPRFASDPIVDHVVNASDEDVRAAYNRCEFFACLRRKEGFELPAIEALLCGARPIMFDTPNYRQWFDGSAEFIPEDGIAETATRLKHLFKKGAQPVSDLEMEAVKFAFNWEHIIGGFWERCMT